MKALIAKKQEVVDKLIELTDKDKLIWKYHSVNNYGGNYGYYEAGSHNMTYYVKKYWSDYDKQYNCELTVKYGVNHTHYIGGELAAKLYKFLVTDKMTDEKILDKALNSLSNLD